ncbi:EamA/RhaT family transporter, partial [Francisella tularensis subsp. holarctica]|nr:EamA/RhaT family transporter [Francisella tularensis subsp. holarctica]
KSNIFVGISFAILDAIFWGLEGVIFKMLLNANIAINTLLFLRKISTIIIFLPLTWAIIQRVNISILPITLDIGINGY